MSGSSSIGVNLGGCLSDPHSSRDTQTGYASMQRTRLSSIRPNNEHFTDRLADSRPYDHQASMTERLASFNTQFGNSNGPSGSNPRD